MSMARVSRSLSGSQERRLFAGFIVQPVLAGVLAFGVFPFLLLDRNGRTIAGGFPTDVSDAALSVAVSAAIVAFFITLVGALPIAVWLTKRRMVSLGESLLWGLGFGNVPIVLGTILAGTHGLEGFVRGAAFASLLGMAGAVTLWTIALRRD
jgi:hypothetical protein